MPFVCADCRQPLIAGQDTRATRRGPICPGCGRIADMQLRAANDTLFEDWPDEGGTRAERDRDR